MIRFFIVHVLRPIVLSVSLAWLLASMLQAQASGGAVAAAVPTGSAKNESETVYELEEFFVVAERYGAVGDFSLVSIQVLEAAELERQIQATLGETLAWEPGLNASYFGPGASRPVIRGLGDYRVRMLVDDIGTLDVSDNSPDHGVPLEPLLIRRVDIHRGPDALLFGNAAIGGAINSQTRVLPEELPAQVVSGSVETRYETAADGRSVAAYGTARTGEFALRLTGAARRADDYDIPGSARTAEYERNANPPDAFPTLKNTQTGASERVPNPVGKLTNTQLETVTNSIGALWEPESGVGRLGLAYSRYESNYGVPYQYPGPGELYGDTDMQMWQSRVDLDASLETDLEWFERLRFRLGHADYGHEEWFVGRAWQADTVFTDTLMGLESSEARVDLFHRFLDTIEGVVGVHGFERELDVSGRFQKNPNSLRIPYLFETSNVAAFLVETFTLGQWTVRGGYRYERQQINNYSNQINGIGGVFGDRGESHSLAGGLTWRKVAPWIFDELALTLNLSRIERLPSETERYASWSNPAIGRFVLGTFYQGDPYQKESSSALELGAELHRGDWSGRINLFHYDFENFIFLEDQKGFGNLAQYLSKDATFRGGEAELTWRVQETDTSAWRIKGMIDFVQGENNTDDTYLPRIPPLRVGSRIECEQGAFHAGADLRYAFKQDNTQAATASAARELETDAYFELNLDAQYRWTLADTDLTVFARLQNALDAERRAHASFLKDVAPLPGRSLSLGLRWEF